MGTTPSPRNQTVPVPSPGKPPLFTQKAKTARWMAHHLDFGVLSTTSSNADFKGVAFGNPQSFADGTMDNSTGNLYWYMSPMDAEDPRCTRCVFIGGMRSVTTAELPSAKEALFARHPEMESWPSDHNFAVYTMDIENIWLIDMF